MSTSLTINAGVRIYPGVTLNGFPPNGGGTPPTNLIQGDLMTQSGTLDLSTETGSEDLMAN